MKTSLYKLLIIIAITAIYSIRTHAEDLRSIVSLSGSWKFSIGDDDKWSSPSFDDSKWDELEVPGQWESQGYDDYNGYAWYRKFFRLPVVPGNSPLYLLLGKIDDADMVYFNGKEIGKSGHFPPNFETGYNKIRKYVIPREYLNPNGNNLVAVRVYDTYLGGGMTDGPEGIYTDEDNNLLNLNLNGKWKFHTGDNKEWKSPEFNASQWSTVSVPAEWENEGYDNYDGYAWYRLQFRIPQNFISGQLVLSLGKIDDVDDVYLNGRLIGNVFDLEKDADYKHKGWEFNARRLYKIPEGILNRNGINTLAVRVFDSQLRGGIYEGPVGIMSAENYRKYRNKHYSSQSFWDFWYDMFWGEK